MLITVLIGPPCCGKSTYLNTLDYDFVVSSDDIVEVLCRQHNMAYHDYFKLPSASKLKLWHSQIFSQLVHKSKHYQHVVWDLTNLTRQARAIIFKHYPKATFNAVVFDFKGKEDLLLKRNQQRFKRAAKFISEGVLLEMCEKFEPVSQHEAFSKVSIIELIVS